MPIFLNTLVFVAGFAACWYTKDAITKAVTGTEAFIKVLETKAAALRAVL
jgi:hypothetical protein